MSSDKYARLEGRQLWTADLHSINGAAQDVLQACVAMLTFGHRIGDRKGATKKLCDKDYAERSGEFSGAICLKTLV